MWLFIRWNNSRKYQAPPSTSSEIFIKDFSINQFQISQMLPIILLKSDQFWLNHEKTFSEIIKICFIGKSMIFYVIWLTFILLKRRDHFWVRISCSKFAFDLLVRFDGNLIAWRVVLKLWWKISSIFHSSLMASKKNPKKSHAKNSIKKKHQN